MSWPRAFRAAGLAAALAALAAGAARAQETVPAEVCCLELLLPVGARMVGMGQSSVADTTPDAFFSNPAGFDGLSAKQFWVQYRPLLDEGLLLALTFLFARSRLGTLGITYQLVDLGPDVATDENGAVIGELVHQRHVIGGTFATGLAPGLSGGVSYKIFVATAQCGAGSCGETPGGANQLVDVGLRYRPAGSRWLAVGAALVNTGTPLQLINAEQADPTPWRVRAGASYEVLHHFRADTLLAVSLSAQLEGGGPGGGQTVAGVGAQLSVGDAVFLRAGYRGGSGIDTGGAVGIGLKYERVSIAVAKAFATGVLDEDPFHVSFGLRF